MINEGNRQGQSHKVPINYGEHQYWDERYRNTEGKRFEWLQDFKNLEIQILKCLDLKTEKRILHVGCGNSELQDKLYEEGYYKIDNIDISAVVIDQMNKSKELKGYSEMTFEVMDVKEMRYKDQSFDMVLDKSTIDTLMCTDNPILNVAKMTEEIYRVLKDDGVYFVLSYASPSTRLEHITRQNVKWTIQHKQINRLNQQGQNLIHFLYICHKLPLEQSKKSKEWSEQYYKQLQILEKKEYPSLLPQ